INAAYRKEPENTANAVSDILLGMPINYYAVIEYDDIEKIVDTIGGVPMYIEKNMKYSDPKDDPPLYINIKAGQQVLDGEDSVKFLRFRKGYTEGDIGRVKAQQVWMENALSQAIDYGILKVAKVAFKEVDSNITYKAMLSLGTKALGVKSEKISTYMLPFTPDPNAPFYVYPKSDEIEEMVRTIYSIQPDPEDEDDRENPVSKKKN
ncbi:MAG: LCP family protein, partial [Eubacteriales bacterium]|nr:LCP family protein [Eubacteriales bacterium]